MLGLPRFALDAARAFALDAACAARWPDGVTRRRVVRREAA
jgi:hypothetical protein